MCQCFPLKNAIFINSYLRHKFPYELQSNTVLEVSSFKNYSSSSFSFCGSKFQDVIAGLSTRDERKRALASQLKVLLH